MRGTYQSRGGEAMGRRNSPRPSRIFRSRLRRQNSFQIDETSFFLLRTDSKALSTPPDRMNFSGLARRETRSFVASAAEISACSCKRRMLAASDEIVFSLWECPNVPSHLPSFLPITAHSLQQYCASKYSFQVIFQGLNKHDHIICPATAESVWNCAIYRNEPSNNFTFTT